MNRDVLAGAVGLLVDRSLAEGGFRSGAGTGYRPDASAWAVIALRAAGAGRELIQPALERLAVEQAKDGRLSISPQHPEAFWPTALGILAWQGLTGFEEAKQRAVHFLLTTTGLHFEHSPDSPVAHDPTIPGWPWIAQTHSWVIPTALAILALRVAGQGEHGRVKEGRRLLMDRQLPGGGWNYGNTKVFGMVLHPMPESTGLALNAVAGSVDRSQVALSLAYLGGVTPPLRTPKGLAWSLLGLGAWGERPAAAGQWLAQTFGRQERFGPFDTEALALLVIALQASGGLESLYPQTAGLNRGQESSRLPGRGENDGP